MGLAAAISKPPTCILVNVAANESILCLFNPTQLVEKVSVNWVRQQVLGMSYQPLQYQGTSNRTLPSVEFYLDKFYAAEALGSPDITNFRNFIRALTVPPQSPTIEAPPRTLVIWPRVMVIETVLTDVEFRYTTFASDSSALIYTAVCTFEEILDARVTSEDRRAGN